MPNGELGGVGRLAVVYSFPPIAGQDSPSGSSEHRRNCFGGSGRLPNACQIPRLPCRDTLFPSREQLLSRRAGLCVYACRLAASRALVGGASPCTGRVAVCHAEERRDRIARVRSAHDVLPSFFAPLLRGHSRRNRGQCNESNRLRDAPSRHDTYISQWRYI